MAASNLYFNLKSATFTPSGGGAVTIKHELSLRISRRVSQEPFFGFNRKHPVLIRNHSSLFQATLSGGDVAQAFTLTEGTVGTLVGVLADAGGDSLTDKTLTLSNAVVGPIDIDVANNRYAGHEVSFLCAGGANDEVPLVIS